MPPNPLDYQIHTAKIQDLGDTASKSALRFNETQAKVIEEYVSVVEKIALYSAGIISLSITFFGGLLDKHVDLLHVCVFGVATKNLLLYSWIAFLIAFITGLFTRWFNATYLFWSSRAEQVNDSNALTQARIDYAKADFEIVSLGGKNTQEWLINAEHVHEGNKKLHEDVKPLSARYFTIKTNIRRVCFFSFSLGLVLLAAAVAGMIKQI